MSRQDSPSPAVIEREPPAPAAADLVQRYRRIRAATERLCEPLETEDFVIQSMPDVSPAKWHLAHTSWFFETFLVAPQQPSYRPFHPQYSYLFNSYYVSVGERHERPRRGLLSRPTVSEVYAYRRYVDEHMIAWLEQLDAGALRRFGPLVELGLNHEQQHQELLLTDIKHVFGINPLHPVYRRREAPPSGEAAPAAPATLTHWVAFPESIEWIGHAGGSFAYDNELPRHRVLIEPFRIASRPVTNGEFRAFVEDGGYTRASLWLSDGWATVEQERWHAPLYWIRQNGTWWQYTLTGVLPLANDEPVCHVSYFEADAYARWAGARLPTEFEWEYAARDLPVQGNFVESGWFHPRPIANHPARTENAAPLDQMFGDVWEWTASQYSPYPGYVQPPGAVGEYNGKFMCNQFVLRGGSCATPRDHLRPTYRNFFPPAARWQFTGVRLAQNP
ncbi:MAG TPA: ergothioneine biosynthesis protein EgtB [Phycisphaerae bacterium]|nr:ergothioneine biosynthesis protein EgtB [Phycisphaerae bacterium]